MSTNNSITFIKKNANLFFKNIWYFKDYAPPPPFVFFELHTMPLSEGCTLITESRGYTTQEQTKMWKEPFAWTRLFFDEMASSIDLVQLESI